jgi:alpha-glucosidase
MQKIILSLAVLLSSNSIFAQTIDVSSPDGKIVLNVNDEGKPSYKINFAGESIIKTSRLGMAFKDTMPFSDGFTISASQKESANEVWQLPWGERKNVTDYHNELLVTFAASDKADAKKFRVRFRLFNDGVGFRYEVPKPKDLDQV